MKFLFAQGRDTITFNFGYILEIRLLIRPFHPSF